MLTMPCLCCLLCVVQNLLEQFNLLQSLMPCADIDNDDNDAICLCEEESSRVFNWMATVGADEADLWASEGRVAMDKMTQISCWADDADEEDALQAIAYRITTVG
jgi:hypothetical protein